MVKIIGLCGSIGAGKGEVNKYLIDKYDYVQVTVGDMVREETKKKGLKITRDNTDQVSEELRSKNGQDYFMKQIVMKIHNEGLEKVVVDGIRLPNDVQIFKKSFGKDFILLKVDASPKVRFERLKTRGRPGFPETLEKFKEHEERQYKMFKLDKTFSMVDEIIDNSSSYEHLYEEVDGLRKKYKDWF